MGRFYCDYCHCYLTYISFDFNLTSRHDSASVRKAHNLGRNHLQLVREYYSKLGFDKTQSVLDAIAQDYQSVSVQEPVNPFAQGVGITPFAGMGNRSSYTSMGGMTFGGPMPGMPLPPPPGMPLPGGGTAPGGPGAPAPPIFPFAPVPPPNTGGRVEG